MNNNKQKKFVEKSASVEQLREAILAERSGGNGVLPPSCTVQVGSDQSFNIMQMLFAVMWQSFCDEQDAQAKEVESIPEGFTRNEKGHLIPNDQIADKELMENALINESHCLMAAMTAGADLIRLHIHSEADALCSMRICDAGGSDKLAQEPGKVTLRNMDGTRNVQIDRRATMSLSPEARVAKDKVMKCIDRRSGNVDKLLLALVNAAWKTNEAGDISVSKVSALFAVPCRDEDWLVAMDAIKAAMRGTGVKTYTRLYARPDANAKWQLREAKV
jgi:hypothetical protein